MWGGSTHGKETTDHVIGGETWRLLTYSAAYVSRCGFDQRWFLFHGETECMDIARKLDGAWWLIDRYACGTPPADSEMTGPFKSEDDARAAMWILIATES